MYISAKNFSYVFSATNPPAAKIVPPDLVTFQTMDCSSNRVKSDTDIEFIPNTEVNPVTGPVFVEGATPGDILAVKIKDIRIGTQAHIGLIPENGICHDRVRSPIVKVCPIEGNMVLFTKNIQIPVRPMVGTIGNAPLGEPIHTIFGGAHGGNLDNILIAPGAIIYLPVFVKGGLLSIGDLHARMGDGELCGLALETSGEVDVEIMLIKNKSISFPMGENEELIFACGCDKTPWMAIEQVSAFFADFLARHFKLSLEEAVMLISAVADFRFSQCRPGVDEMGISARLEISKSILGIRPSDTIF